MERDTRARFFERENRDSKILSATRKPLLGMRFLHTFLGEEFVAQNLRAAFLSVEFLGFRASARFWCVILRCIKTST
jgi:hypothetical protein